MTKVPDNTGGVTADSALYFSFVAECLAQAPSIPNNPGHIYFGIATGKEISAEILAIQDRVERTAFVVRELYQKSRPDKFRQIFHELLNAAQLLAGPKPSPLVTTAVLDRIRETVVFQEGKRIKTRYLNALGRPIATVVFVLLGAAAASTERQRLEEFVSIEILALIPYYSAMLIAATIAIWLSFASRQPRLMFDDLLEPERDMMSPWHRIVYVILFTIILAIFCAAEVVGVSIGKFSTDAITTSIVSALIFGFVCGFSEKLLASTVAPHVTHILGGIGKTKGAAGIN